MVDFPEGYGFAPNESKWLMQSEFVVSIGVYESRTNPYYNNHNLNNPTIYRSKVKGGSPYSFAPFGRVVKNDEQQLYGYMLSIHTPPTKFNGTLQEICTAMCTVHRLTGGRT
jgi:hypothetical protein